MSRLVFSTSTQHSQLRKKKMLTSRRTRTLFSTNWISHYQSFSIYFAHGYCHTSLHYVIVAARPMYPLSVHLSLPQEKLKPLSLSSSAAHTMSRTRTLWLPDTLTRVHLMCKRTAVRKVVGCVDTDSSSTACELEQLSHSSLPSGCKNKLVMLRMRPITFRSLSFVQLLQHLCSPPCWFLSYDRPCFWNHSLQASFAGFSWVAKTLVCRGIHSVPARLVDLLSAVTFWLTRT